MLRPTFAAMAGLLLLPAFAASTFAVKPSAGPSAGPSARQALDAFNQKFIAAGQKMDQPAAAALWADDGVDLPQGMQPIAGKAAIAKWLNGLTPQLQGAKMLYCTVDWRDGRIEGDWAYEWGINRQKIAFPPPQESFANEGKILLIVKRQAEGDWKLELESWNSNPQPEKKPSTEKP
jgi:uncharacterized protein (TIGR02246 family)